MECLMDPLYTYKIVAHSIQCALHTHHEYNPHHTPFPHQPHSYDWSYIILAPFKKQTISSNQKKDGKFSIDLVDPLLNTFQTSNNIFYNCLMTKH